MIILMFLVWALFGFICYKMAEARGRDVWFGCLMGVLFGIFAIIGYAIIGNSDKKKSEIMAETFKEFNKEKSKK